MPATGIDALETQSIPFATEPLKVPPWNSILSADDCRVRPQYRLQLRRELRQAVRLHPKKNNIYRSYLFEGTGDFRPRRSPSG